MTIDVPGRRHDVFAGAFASMRQAACLLEPVQQGRGGRRDWRYIAFNPAMQRLFKVADPCGLVLRDVHPDIAYKWQADLERVVTVGKAETLIRQFGRKPRLLRIELSPLPTAGGDAVLVQIWNITGEHVAAKMPEIDAALQKTQAIDAQSQILSLMSKVGLLARLSAASYLKVDEYVDHLSGRLQAMSRTQTKLARLPNTRIDLADLVYEELLANAIYQDQCIAECPSIALAPHPAEIVTLAIHELTTNSIKFGALGAFGEKGTVRISWAIRDRDQVPWLSFKWDETCSRRGFIPIRKGFGTSLIEERIAYELQGEGRLHVHNAGVTVEFAFPLN